ncbi:response regulator transcription factor [Niabella drilacis]|uniref:Two component transcriptional regulator, LuxR family n=1 Tax=Niabella drilacis (strain DSM 25811 / CCM 8410 / CCUG 62505 / LMG 26954 / E90) TaxID=1285928 RepID=A0A1G6PPL8_NIADE|nr:response regulator transcription factor [Niabella drilacis]SDC82192.1 two component transcriptional regulator, LuxR family [Niabella drilacis]
MRHSIVIVDDHILIAQALSTMISSIPNFDVLYVCSSGPEMIERFNQAKNIPDLVILDVQMPVMDGYTVAKWLTEQHPEVIVLALSMQDDDEKIIKMIRSGAKGYLLKSIQQKELAHALNTIVKDGIFYDAKVSKALANDYIRKEVTQQELSAKERELIPWLCSDSTYKEIAASVFLSARTVESYATSIMEKLDVRNRVGLVLTAVKKGWI